MQLEPSPAQELSGNERFDGLEASVVEFWRFAMSDLRINNVRGYLAEFIVAQALGSTERRVEWDPWDVTAPDGTRIEVKSSAYLQAWSQKRLSRPAFRVARAHGWDEGMQARTVDKGFHADAYVFCLHTATAHEHYDPLDMSQWQFYVASRSAIEDRKGASMGLTTLSRLAGAPVPYPDLRETVIRAGAPTRQSRNM